MSFLFTMEIKQDFEDEQVYILTRCMFDVFLNLETAEKSQVICDREVVTLTVHQNLVFLKTACSEGRLCD